MDWSSSNLRTFVPVIPKPSETTSFDILFNHHYHDHRQFIPVLDQLMMNKQTHAAATMENNYNNTNPTEDGMRMSCSYSSSGGQSLRHRDHRNSINKKRLTSEQLESLERSFQEEIKLDPDRKLKLSRELGLHPRQIAVWFQNRRARWKSKQLELLYDSLKQEYDAVSRERDMLQEEVMKLKCMLREQAATRSAVKKVTAAGITEMSGEETVESTSAVAAIRSSNRKHHHHHHHHHRHLIPECNYLFNVDEYSPAAIPSPFWGLMPAN